LGDFGGSYFLNLNSQQRNEQITNSKLIKKDQITNGYEPPEVNFKKKVNSVKMDVYSLGKVLLQCMGWAQADLVTVDLLNQANHDKGIIKMLDKQKGKYDDKILIIIK
jgi:hypothetical protein